MTRRPRSPPAPRRPVFRVRTGCDCLTCREKEQLHLAATHHPVMPVRLVAIALLDALDDVQQGRVAGGDLGGLFD